MTDSPSRKKRYGAGVCWEYMDKGSCPCKDDSFPHWHPRLTLSTSTIKTGEAGPSAVVAIMPKVIPEWIESLKYLGFIEGDCGNFAVLDTKYEQREEVKKLGASYSPGMKKWIVVQGQDLAPFAKWNPRVHNRLASEIVLHNPYIDMTSAVKELRRCGLHSSQFSIQGSGVEVDNLRNELSNRNNSRAPLTDDNGEGAKRSLWVHNIQQKRPRFSTPESLQTFVREGTMQTSQTAVTPAPPSDELSTLLSSAKGALVRCNIANISNEQKQFNEAIFNVMETLAAKVKRAEGNKVMKTRDVSNRSTDADHVSPRHMATPIQKGTKSPGVPSTWYDFS